MQKDSLLEIRGNGSAAWYADWQDSRHARLFDARAGLSRIGLARNLESFNDVQILRKRYGHRSSFSLLEVGCATGEFFRYLRHRYPNVRYAGLDISAPALERASRKYPGGEFLRVDPEGSIRESLERAGLPPAWDVVYSKDVLHHQTDPWGFLSQLLAAASETVIFRTRTRDRGPTVLDPERSCQRHYQGWMPYLVFNTEEVIRFLKERAPEAEVTVRRSYQVLGGRENRYLPKECYLPETGTAETAVAVVRRTDRPGRVSFDDVPDGVIRPSFLRRLARGFGS